MVLPVLIAVFAIAGTALYLAGAGKESTDDAFVEGHVVNVASLPRPPLPLSSGTRHQR